MSVFANERKMKGTVRKNTRSQKEVKDMEVLKSRKMPLSSELTFSLWPIDMTTHFLS